MGRSSGSRDRLGFTLVELLVAMAIGVILMAGLYQFFVSQRRTYTTQDEVGRAQQEARMAETLISKAVQLAGSYVPGAGTTVSMRGQSILAATDRYLTLQYDDPLNTADLNFVSAQEVVTFAVSKTAPTVGGGTDTINATVWFDKNGNGTIEDPTDRANLSIGLDLSGPPYTLYRITPTVAGGINAEAIASNVDNLIFRYYDGDGNPVTRDATTGAEILATTPLTQLERADVRAVDVELVLRTRSEDARYNEPFPRTPDSVATYSSAGVRNAVTADFNDNFRRRAFRSRITPRSLAISSCGRLDLTASPATPICPNGTTVTATVLNQYRQPVSGATVIFGAGDGTPTSATGTTDASGQASFNHGYTGTSKPISVWAQADVDCTTATGTNTVTLHNSTTANYLPGPPYRVDVGTLSATEINSCDAPNTATFDAKVFDQCNNLVIPADSLYLEAVLTSGPTGTIDGGASAKLANSTQTFTVGPPTTGPYGAPDAWGDFHLNVQVAGGATTWTPPGGFSGSPLPLTLTVHPWQPETLVWFPALTNLLATHEDCPTADQADQFQALDCKGNAVYKLAPSFPYPTTAHQVRASIAPDGVVVDPADHGTVYSNVAGVLPAALATEFTVADSSGGLFDVGYHPPTCTLGPPPGAGNTKHPVVSLELKESGGTVKNTLATPLTLQACGDCSVTFQVNPTPCTQLVPVTISGCDLGGKTVELEVTASGLGRGAFDANFTTTTLTHTFPAATNAFDANLYIENQAGGDTYTVTAYYPNKASARWSCSGTVTVVTGCNNLKIYTAKTYLPANQLQAGAGTCLASVKELFFEVSDCQARLTKLPHAVEVWTEANGVEFDHEWVDLVAAPTGVDPARFELDTLQFSLPPPSTGGLPMLASNTHTSGDRALTYPLGQDVRVVARYTDPVDHTDQCTADADFVRPIPVCFPNAITSGGGGTWNGNFDIHWGDVVIAGNVELPSQFIQKFPGASLGGNKVDRFFDIYVGEAAPGDATSGNFLNHGTDVCGSGAMPYRPFLPGEPNFSLANPGGWAFGNYFCNVPNDKILEMIRKIDYVTLKSLAKTRGVYWYTLPSGNVFNPAPGPQVTKPMPATGVPLETVLDMRSTGGGPNGYHNGQFIFIDTYLTANLDSWTGDDIDGMCAPLVSGNPCETPVSLPLDRKLPLHTISGGIYTSGIVYVAGTLDWGGSGGGLDLNGTGLPQAVTPPGRELDPPGYYDDGPAASPYTPVWAPTKNDIPLRPDPALPQSQLTVSNVHINGAVYLDGALDGGGNIRVYGAVTAERGFKGSGSPEVWYNYNLNVSGENLSLCVSCCGIGVDKASAILFPGQTIDLNAVNPDGSVYWWSGNNAVATVDQNGLVTALGFGTVTISVRDQSNCVASASIVVANPCDVFKDSTNIFPSSASVPVLGTATFGVNFSPGGSVTWSSSNPSIATVTAAGGMAQGVCPGAVTIAASDPSGSCPTGPDALLQVRSAPCSLAVDPVSTSVTAGSSVPLTATGNQCAVTWSTSNPSLANVSPATGTATTVTAGAATGVAKITATDAAGCTATATVGVGCPAISIRQSPATTPLVPRTSYVFSASGGAKEYTWKRVSGSGTLTPDGADSAVATFVPSGTGTVEIEVTDAGGCSTSVTVAVACPAPTVTMASPANNSVYGRNSASGRSMVWQAVPNDGLGPDPSVGEIDRVDFRVQPDPMGLGVTMEAIGQYCGFGGDDCAAAPGDVGNWPSGNYTFSAEAVTKSTHPCGVQTASTSVQVKLCNVTVRNQAGVELGSTYSMNRRTTEQFSVLHNNGVVTWTSSDAGTFTVDPTGLVNAQNVGSTRTATLTATDGIGCAARVDITVVK